MRLLRALLPQRISSQIAALIIVSLLAIHAILTTWFFLQRSHEPRDQPAGPAGQIESLIRLIDATAPDARAPLIASIDRAFPQLAIGLSATSGFEVAAAADNRFVEGLRRHLGPDFSVGVAESGRADGNGAQALLAIRLRDGATLTARAVSRSPPPMIRGPIAVTLMSFALSLALLGWWATQCITAPLRAFATAAENFSLDRTIQPLSERGPAEIRTVAKALNQMRSRIKGLVEARTRMLAAMGHDLRTPLTRMRLRSEFIDDLAVRRQTLADLDQMQSMIDSGLVFLRDGQSPERATTIDIAASLQTICDQFSDLGHDVRYDGPDHAPVEAYPDTLHRALSNLVDNAVRYGKRAIVRLATTPASVTISVEDDGPGIAAKDQEAMFEPFVRGDAARTMNETTGFGLGLSIARSIVEAHGGALSLRNREPTGLAATVVLPVASATADQRPKLAE